MKCDTAMLHMPIEATYRMIDGEPVMIDAVYADIPADAIARLLMRGFGIPITEEGNCENEKTQ